MGIEPTSLGWKPNILPLYYTRLYSGADGGTRNLVVNFGRVVHNFSATPAYFLAGLQGFAPCILVLETNVIADFTKDPYFKLVPWAGIKPASFFF